MNVRRLHDLKAAPRMRKEGALTLNGLKEQMHLSLREAEAICKEEVLPFNELVHGYSERVQSIASQMVNKQVEKDRDQKMLKQIEQNKIKRSNSARSTKASDEARSTTSRNSKKTKKSKSKTKSRSKSARSVRSGRSSRSRKSKNKKVKKVKSRSKSVKS